MATVLSPTPRAGGRFPLPGQMARRAPLRSSPLGARLRGYWPGTWKAAMVLIALLAIRLPEMYPPIIRIRPSICAGLVIGTLLMQRVGPSAWRATFHTPLVRWTIAYTALILITIPFALWVGGSFGLVYSLPFMGLMVVTIMLCQPTRETLDRIVRWTVLLTAVYASYVLTFGRIYADVLGGDRLGGTGTYDPNDLAALMVIATLLGFGMTLRERPLWRVIGAVSAVAALMVALKTGSRGGTVALVTGTIALLLSQRPARFFLLSTLVALATPIMWFFGPESFRVRTASLFTLQNDYTFQSDAGRWIIWQRGLGYFVHRPIIGVGPNNYGLLEGQYFTSQGRSGAWLTAHNTYLQVLVEIGIFGAIALGGMLIAAIRGSYPQWRRPRPDAPNRLYRPEIFAALVAFLTSAFFLSHGYNPLLFFSVALSAFAGRVGQAEGVGIAVPAPRRSARNVFANAAARAANIT